MSRKKIVFVCLTFHWPPLGGAWVDEYEVMSRLSEKYDLTLIVPSFERFFPRGKIEKEMPFKVVRIPFNIVSFNRFILSRKIRSAVDKISPDVIFIGESGVMRPHISNALTKYKVIHRFYSTSIWCFNQNYFQNGAFCGKNIIDDFFQCVLCASKMWSDRLHEFIAATGFSPTYVRNLEKTYRNAYAIIVYNERIKSLLSGWNENVRVFPGGVDCEKFKPLRKEPNKKRLEIILPGRADDPAKGLNVLLKAVKEMKELEKKIRIKITWCHSEPPDGVDNIEIAPWMQFDEVEKFYRGADICVVPSLWEEPFGITALEAMACEIPVIASRIGGLQSIVVDGKTGFLFEPGNSSELRQKLISLIENEELRRKMGKEGLTRVRENYSWEALMKKYYFPLVEEAVGK
ncbi:MAG: glycosyltransferase family 1 protein [Candidatus Schekmanbacteria bacterium]|nr:MAG: glycosyltransferase family 1 protein [Candidatus Schekmanbacteria bacterium]